MDFLYHFNNMKAIIENINQILSEWDPIGVGKTISIDEYRGYIPYILKHIENKQQLINCLEDILINKIGIDYNREDNNHYENLQNICDKLIQLYKNI
jgi:hypothetical protein